MTSARSGRELTVAVVGGVTGAGLVLLAAGQTWISGRAATGTLSTPVSVAGTSVAPLARAFALAALAGAVAVLAARRWGRRVVGALVVGAGAAAGAATVGPLTDPAGALAGSDEVADVRVGRLSEVSVAGWPWVAVAGALLVCLAGLATLVRAPAWPAMGSRYERSADTAERAPRTRAEDPIELWRALDRGEDPTDPSRSRRP